jgi:TetR/AcrR family fatty acid metabolism transcriptional regulator
MNAAPEDKREQLRAARRSQILEAALRVFLDKGYHVTNVSDVAAEAGVSQGTIYWYFDSKDELFNAAVSEFFADFGQEVLGAFEGVSSATQKLQVLGEAMVGFTEQASGMFAMFVGYLASAQDRTEAASSWVDLLVGYKDALVAIIDEGIAAGEFRSVDPEGLAWSILAAYDGLAAYYLLMPEIDTARVSRAFVDMVLAGVER